MNPTIARQALRSASRTSASSDSRLWAKCLPSSSSLTSSLPSASSRSAGSIRLFNTTRPSRETDLQTDPNEAILPGSQSSNASASSFRSSQSSFTRSSNNPNRPHHRLHVQASRNNTLLTLTTPSGDPLSSSSGGTAGFKKAQRSGYEAAYRAAFQMFNSINNNRLKWGLSSIEIIWKGFGQGREAVYRALMAQEGEEIKLRVAKMIDSTPIKVGGVRPKKRRSEYSWRTLRCDPQGMRVV